MKMDCPVIEILDDVVDLGTNLYLFCVFILNQKLFNRCSRKDCGGFCIRMGYEMQEEIIKMLSCR